MNDAFREKIWNTKLQINLLFHCDCNQSNIKEI